MSREEKNPTKSSIINYVKDFVDRRDNESEDVPVDDSGIPIKREVDKNSIFIKTDDEDYHSENLNNRASSAMTDIDADELNLDSDPVIEIQQGGEQVYRQQVYLRQYQPPTPDPIDIQVQEVIIKPKVQRPPIHVHVGPGQNAERPRTPSPILIKSAPPPPPPLEPSSNEPLVYNKYVPLDYKQPPQQIIIHRYPEMPPKPRPIVVEQWLPNKPAPKRITYRPVNRDEFVQNEFERQRNRYIEYTKPHTTIEVEIVRLPVIRLKPEEYQHRSGDLTRIDRVRSITQDPNTLNWRI